jgi:hypothetical protein
LVSESRIQLLLHQRLLCCQLLAQPLQVLSAPLPRQLLLHRLLLPRQHHVALLCHPQV